MASVLIGALALFGLRIVYSDEDSCPSTIRLPACRFHSIDIEADAAAIMEFRKWRWSFQKSVVRN